MARPLLILMGLITKAPCEAPSHTSVLRRAVASPPQSPSALGQQVFARLERQSTLFMLMPSPPPSELSQKKFDAGKHQLLHTPANTVSHSTTVPEHRVPVLPAQFPAGVPPALPSSGVLPANAGCNRGGRTFPCAHWGDHPVGAYCTNPFEVGTTPSGLGQCHPWQRITQCQGMGNTGNPMCPWAPGSPPAQKEVCALK